MLIKLFSFLYAMLIITTTWATIPEQGLPEGPGNIYGLKVYYQILSVSSTDQEMVLDVEKSYNSDPHYLQRAINLVESCWCYFSPRSYYLETTSLYGMLTLAAGHAIEPQTSDQGPLTRAWHAYNIWNGLVTGKDVGLLSVFQEAFPKVKTIRLVTQSSRAVELSSYDTITLQAFKGAGILITSSSMK